MQSKQREREKKNSTFWPESVAGFIVIEACEIYMYIHFISRLSSIQARKHKEAAVELWLLCLWCCCFFACEELTISFSKLTSSRRCGKTPWLVWLLNSSPSLHEFLVTNNILHSYIFRRSLSLPSVYVYFIASSAASPCLRLPCLCLIVDSYSPLQWKATTVVDDCSDHHPNEYGMCNIWKTW